MSQKLIKAILEFDKDFVDRYPDTYEQYAVLSSRAYKDLFGNKEDVPEYAQEGLLKISKGCKSIYRKYKGKSIKDETNYVVVGYRSRKYLGVNEREQVVVKPTWWLPYLWHYYDTPTKHAFRLAVISLFLTLLFEIATLLLGCK